MDLAITAKGTLFAMQYLIKVYGFEIYLEEQYPLELYSQSLSIDLIDTNRGVSIFSNPKISILFTLTTVEFISLFNRLLFCDIDTTSITLN